MGGRGGAVGGVGVLAGVAVGEMHNEGGGGGEIIVGVRGDGEVRGVVAGGVNGRFDIDVRSSVVNKVVGRGGRGGR